MSRNQRYSTRIGVRTNLKAILHRLTLDITTLDQVEVLYITALPNISKAAKAARDTCTLLKALVEDMRSNI